MAGTEDADVGGDLYAVADDDETGVEDSEAVYVMLNSDARVSNDCLCD